ncbi:hypothetical protein SAMN05421819_1401 [Bryocella elongata]|uniref:Uncharacterized protein n=1 Tax=Bryocella elongata TaxID=863522 RepID=A0A1H5W1R0_9BACT|nr:hypothetical protein [Bryocella elongata]SEF93218.1 hypothetical protein SAMN05421819_1401 [Bryocella elongata]
MRLIEAIADAFIATFGITVPDEKARERASWFILGLMVLTVLVVTGVGITIYHFMHD